MVRFLKLFIPVVAVVFLVAIFAVFNNKSSAQTTPPLVCGNSVSNVILDIDRSGSMSKASGGTGSKLKNAKIASRNFVDILAKDSRNRVGVVSFATQATIDQGLTNNYSAVKDAINSLSAKGNTCTECGIFKANRNIKNNKRVGVKNVVILLADGEANVIRGSNSKVGKNLAERKTIDEVKKGNAESGTIYFTIGLGNNINTAFLKEIASVTGGKYYSSPSTDQLDTIYQQISQIIAEGAISGVVYNDENENGTQDAGENNLEGWTINLDQTGATTKSLTSDIAGGYTFGGLCNGSYNVSQNVKSDWSQTEPTSPEGYSLNLTGGATLANTNFGNAPAPTQPPPPACIRNTPTLMVAPNIVTGEAGVEQVFDVKITNNDSQECSSSTFNISGIINNFPLWDVSLDQEEFVLSPGETGNSKMRVTPPSSAQNGSFTITVIAQQIDGPQLSTNVNFVVDNPTQPPIEPPTPGATSLILTIGADGIGTTPRIPLGGNKNPLHPNRNYVVSIFDAQDNSPVYSEKQTFTYDSTSEKFKSSFSLPIDFTTGVYNVYVEGPQYLRSQFPGSANIIQEQLNNIASSNFNLIAGDINKNGQSYNSIDLLDYNVLISCSIYGQNKDACNQDVNYSTWSDLSDDGIVDEDDYTLWLKELANQPGAVLSF